MALVEVARTVDVPEGEVRKVVVDGTEIALVNLGAGEFRAVADECSHAHYFLSEGEVDVEDRPGTLGELTRRLADANVNVDLAYTTYGGVKIVIATDDLQIARDVLR